MTKETVELIKNIVLTLTPIATFILALITINKWKKEYKAKVYFDASFKFLKAVFTLRDEFNSMRGPFISVGEMLPKTDNHKDYENENMRHVLKNRYTPFQDCLNIYYSLLPEVEVLFGKEIRKTSKELERVIRRYHTAITIYIQTYGRSDNYKEETEDRIFNSTSNDKLSSEMEVAVKNIEDLVTKHLNLKV